ncbi:4-coumarate--CoA ligase-like 7 [Teleopsis dalmanni]|uniref:4-coumarate--CoA ligase-like 7 n=1 Tax=Teleopsis dalmanni TaxID=139649 RepID=UPI0018CF7193|nr:4-coumarate--CoA ligase-like 7 [Teleopsis dalmanni]
MHTYPCKSSYDHVTKVWSGPPMQLPYGPEYSIGLAALEALQKYPEQIGQISYHNGKSYTNKELELLTIRVAQHFQKLQVQQCDVIGICASNSDFVGPLFFGAMLCGLTVNTLDPSFDKDGIKHIFSITKPKMMFCDGEIFQKVKAAFDESGLKATIYTLTDHIEGVSEITEFLQNTGTEHTYKPEPLLYGLTQTAAILCSSGTTGLPKGVCMSHESILNGLFIKLDQNDRILSFSTLYWVSGLLFLIVGTLRNATRVISNKPFNVEHFFDIVQKYKINFLFTPPSQLAMAVASENIKNYDLSSLETYLCGGSALPYSLVDKIKLHIPNAVLLSGYGMSEVCGCIALGKVSSNGTTGQVAVNCKLKIIDDAGMSLPPGEVGEICIRTQFTWKGYYNNQDATDAIYTKDGWIYSGDMGYMSENGNLFIVDRKKDILKYNNFHFFPTEIESIIAEIEDVCEVCVCGIPDIVSSHLPAAAIVKKPNSHLTEQEVYDYVAKKMVHFKHLRGGVYFMDELSKTASGKNVRRKITEICEELHNAAVHQSNNKDFCEFEKSIKA